jgi:hypothetical protein
MTITTPTPLSNWLLDCAMLDAIFSKNFYVQYIRLFFNDKSVLCCDLFIALGSQFEIRVTGYSYEAMGPCLPVCHTFLLVPCFQMVNARDLDDTGLATVTKTDFTIPNLRDIWQESESAPRDRTKPSTIRRTK